MLIFLVDIAKALRVYISNNVYESLIWVKMLFNEQL